MSPFIGMSDCKLKWLRQPGIASAILPQEVAISGKEGLSLAHATFCSLQGKMNCNEQKMNFLFIAGKQQCCFSSVTKVEIKQVLKSLLVRSGFVSRNEWCWCGVRSNSTCSQTSIRNFGGQSKLVNEAFSRVNVNLSITECLEGEENQMGIWRC